MPKINNTNILATKTKVAAPTQVETTLAGLQPDLDRVSWMTPEELQGLFFALFGHEPPKHARRDFILSNILYQLQMEAFGGLPERTLKQILQLADRFEKNPNYRPTGSVPEYRPGVRLMREFQGKTYEVLVSSNGFIFNGESYSSLSRIAREITGVSWNGPAFFGARHER